MMSWKWVEIYPNREIEQSDERHYIDIDFDNLIGFKMVHKSGKEFELDISQGKPVHFYRNYIIYGTGTPTRSRYTVAGIENGQLYLFKDNGEVVPLNNI
jgi:hypothetical protein